VRLLQCARDSLAQSPQHPIYPACGDSGQNRGDSGFTQRPQELCHSLQPQQSTAWDGELPDAGGLSISQRSLTTQSSVSFAPPVPKPCWFIITKLKQSRLRK
jgi:hypothetical protein